MKKTRRLRNFFSFIVVLFFVISCGGGDPIATDSVTDKSDIYSILSPMDTEGQKESLVEVLSDFDQEDRATMIDGILRAKAGGPIQVTLPDMNTVKTYITVSVTTSDLTRKNIFAYSAEIEFDPELVEPIGVSIEGTLTRGWGTPKLFDTSTPGRIALIGAGTIPLDGAGVLVNLKFKRITEQQCQTAELDLVRFMFNSGLPRAETSDGKVLLTDMVGDLTGNGEIEDMDIILLLIYLADPNTNTLTQKSINRIQNFVGDGNLDRDLSVPGIVVDALLIWLSIEGVDIKESFVGQSVCETGLGQRKKITKNELKNELLKRTRLEFNKGSTLE